MKKYWTIMVLIAVAACSRPTAEDGGRALIQNKGSDTLVNVAQAWAENYKDINPDVAVAVTGGGSGTGISAMINGTVDIANASRKMKEKEIEMARGNGIDPIEWVVGYSGLAYATPEVRMPCVATEKGGDCVTPSMESAIDRSYPVARPLFMYTAGQPVGTIKEYLDWILSEEGQCIIQNKGYAPVGEVLCS